MYRFYIFGALFEDRSRCKFEKICITQLSQCHLIASVRGSNFRPLFILRHIHALSRFPLVTSNKLFTSVHAPKGPGEDYVLGFSHTALTLCRENPRSGSDDELLKFDSTQRARVIEPNRMSACVKLDEFCPLHGYTRFRHRYFAIRWAIRRGRGREQQSSFSLAFSRVESLLAFLCRTHYLLMMWNFMARWIAA